MSDAPNPPKFVGFGEASMSKDEGIKLHAALAELLALVRNDPALHSQAGRNDPADHAGLRAALDELRALLGGDPASQPGASGGDAADRGGVRAALGELQALLAEDRGSPAPAIVPQAPLAELARPRKKPNRRRHHIERFRTDDAEHAAIKARAREAALSVGAYIRARALGDPGPQQPVGRRR